MSARRKYQSIIISPSGNFYGSEQVLFDYVSASKLSHLVFVRGKGLLYHKLKALRYVACSSFDSIFLLYLKVCLRCLVSKINSVYLNEAGHIRYIQILTKLFPEIKFAVHVRILEDTNNKRWTYKINRNLEVLSISVFIQQQLLVKSKLLYDPYRFSLPSKKITSPKTVLHIGILGRITLSKGIKDILSLLNLVQKNFSEHIFIFHFYGEVSDDVLREEKGLKKYTNVLLEGFVENKNDLFNSIDCVLHAAFNEPLGRVFLDAINYHIPFVGVNCGGIGEIAEKVDLSDMLVESNKDAVHHLLYRKLIHVKDNYMTCVENMIHAKTKAESIFNLPVYVSSIDSILSSRDN